MTGRRLFAGLGIVLGIVGLALNYAVIMPAVTTVSETNPVARSLPDALIYYFSFFTHLTNLGLVLVYLSDMVPGLWLGWFQKPTTRAMMASVIILVMLFYHFMLAPTLTHLTGVIVYTNVLLHYATPILYLVWWALFSPHGALRFVQIPLLLVPPLLYLAYVLLRGALVAEYPYAIVDAGTFGYGQVAINAAVLTLAVAAFAAAVVGADKLLARRS
jgi:hypothetical protein